MVRPPRSNAEGGGPPPDIPLGQRVESEVGRMRETLSHLIEFSGMSRREVEQRLGQRGCGTDLGRLLSGRLDLKMKHVLALCRVIDLEPVEFLQIALRPRPGQRSPLLRRLQALLPQAGADACPPSPPAAAPDLADLARRVHELAERLDGFLRAAGIGATAG
jgi:hypothetical protein